MLVSKCANPITGNGYASTRIGISTHTGIFWIHCQNCTELQGTDLLKLPILVMRPKEEVQYQYWHKFCDILRNVPSHYWYWHHLMPVPVMYCTHTGTGQTCKNANTGMGTIQRSSKRSQRQSWMTLSKHWFNLEKTPTKLKISTSRLLITEKRMNIPSHYHRDKQKHNIRTKT